MGSSCDFAKRFALYGCVGSLYFASSHLEGDVCSTVRHLRNVSQCFQSSRRRSIHDNTTSKVGSLESYRRMPGFIESEILPYLPFSNSNVTLNLWRYCWLFGRQYSNTNVASWEGYAHLNNTKHFYTLLKHILVIVRSLDLR